MYPDTTPTSGRSPRQFFRTRVFRLGVLLAVAAGVTSLAVFAYRWVEDASDGSH
jgi:hypothetical protein